MSLLPAVVVNPAAVAAVHPASVAPMRLYQNGTAAVLVGVVSSQASTVMVLVPVAPTPL